MVRVWIAARLAVIREGVRALLSDDESLELLFPATVDAGALTRELASSSPAVLLLDIDLLEREGWGLLRDIVQAAPGVAAVVMGDAPDDRRVSRALSFGARGYLLRETSGAEIRAAIQAAYLGLFVLDPNVGASVLSGQFAAPGFRINADGAASGSESADSELIEPLTERELEVLRLMARGLANKQIAAQLFVTEHTVKFHIRSILGKLGATNRTEAVTLALGRGLVNL